MTFPTITILSYRPDVLVASLGCVDDNTVSSDFKFYVHAGYDTEGISARLTEIAATDIRERSKNARYPFHRVVLLANGELPTGDLKHDLDRLQALAMVKATELVAEETRAANMQRLQEERARRERLELFSRDKDLDMLLTLLGKFTRDELIRAGIFMGD